MLSFNNTEIAFADKTNTDLKWAYWLFKIVSDAKVVGLGSKLTTIAFAIHLPIKKIIKATIFKQFCGGETIDECEVKINSLGKSGIGTILDYSVEGKESETDFDNCMRETIATIIKSKTNKNIPFCVFKVTGLARFGLLEKINSGQTLSSAETNEYEKVKFRIHSICNEAQLADTPIFIDAEETWIQNTIDELALEMMKLYNHKKAIVYTTLQFYRKDRLAYLKKSSEWAKTGNYFFGVKLVRGAYMEKERNRASELGYPSPIHETKQDTDSDYDVAVSFCMDNLNHISFCAATHNENSCMQLVNSMQKSSVNLSDKRIYFAQLLGMSDHISYNLANAGYNVAKYVPYGPVKEVLPYLIRRAQENTFVKGQTGRELSLIIKEKTRRGLVED